MSSLRAVLVLVPLLLSQFGLHMAILNAPMTFMECRGVEGNGQDCIADWHPGWASASYALGGLLGSIFAGLYVSFRSSTKLSTHFQTYQLATVSFLVGSIIIACAHTQTVVVVARIFSGFGAGISINCCPILLNRLSPAHRRGMIGSLSQISINAGIILAQLLGLFADPENWRKIMYAAVVVSCVNAALLYTRTSPSSIAEYSREAEMLADDIQTELTTGEPPAPADSDVHGVGLLTFIRNRRYRVSLICTVTIFCVQQMTGINSIIQYGVWIMSLAVPNYSKVVNVGISLINFFVTIVAAGLVDILGRKNLLLLSLLLTGLSTGALAFGLIRGLGGFSVLAVISTVASFAIGIGPIPFLYISDITPKEAVGMAQSVGTAVSWISTFVVLERFPFIQHAYGPASYYLFSVLTLASALFYAFFLPKG